MKCPHLIKWVIESCKADCRPYVPSLSELEGYCSNEDHRKCSFFQKVTAASHEAVLRAFIENREDSREVRNGAITGV